MLSWRQKVRVLEKENRFLQEQIQILQSKIKELEKHLLMYENAHTPPSKSRKKRPKKKSKGKLGAPKGHPKWERAEPKPTGRVEYFENQCPHCKAKLGKPYKTNRIIEEEIPEPQPIEVIEHSINHYKCPICKKEVIAKNNALVGRFGRNVLTHVTLMKYEDRLPLRNVTNSLERHYGIRITNVGVFKITKRVAKKLEKPYKTIIMKIRKAFVVYVDETEIKVDGQSYHIWTFVTYNETLFVIRKSRGSDVIEEILGKKYAGTICCDGWKAYVTYSRNLQRCWAHLLREAEELAKKYTEFEGFYMTLKAIYKKIKNLRNKPPPLKVRVSIKKKFQKKLEQLTEQMNAYTPFRKFAGKIKNGLEYWFTCVTNLFIEPTNNIAERALRELVVQRKIIGGLRREKGARIMEVITSMIATLKMRNMPVFHTIKSLL